MPVVITLVDNYYVGNLFTSWVDVKFTKRNLHHQFN